MTIRNARPEEREILDSIVRLAYEKYLDRMSVPPAPVLEDRSASLEEGNIWVIGDPPAGLLELNAAGGALMIRNVAVLPEKQGMGLGRQLLEFAEQQARDMGVTLLTLYTNEVMIENIAVYLHLGYRITDRRREGQYNRVYMEKKLQRKGGSM